MRFRFSLGWRSVFVAAAVASLILLPFSQTLSADRGKTESGAPSGGIAMVQRGEEAPGTVATYSRANYVWPFAQGPYYGDHGQGQAPGLLRTPVGVFDLSKDLEIPGQLRAQNRLAQKGVQYFIVQVDPASVEYGSLDQLREAIESRGGAVIGYAPDSALVARLTPAAMAQVDRVAGVTTVVAYQPAFKLHPAIGRAPLADPIKAVSEVYSLDVRVFPGEDTAIVAQALTSLGGEVTAIYPDNVHVDIHRSKLTDVAALEPVQIVFENIPAMLHGEETTTSLMTGGYRSGAVPYHDVSVDGGGNPADGVPAQVLMVLDTGIQLDAGDLSQSRTAAGNASATHRKVRVYQTTNQFGGNGDLDGCDAGPSGGFTHGHMVAAVAMGNATQVGAGYGLPWLATDPDGNVWKLDGVAKGAVLVAYDAAPTPAATSCQDPLLNNILPGDLYTSPASGSLGASYANHNARTANFSWGRPLNQYDSDAIDIDTFLVQKRDAMVFVSAGNAGMDSDNDGKPDLGSLGSPATTKNGMAIGASRAAADQAGDFSEVNERAFFSSTGPAPGGRVAPVLMAPGDEAGGGIQGLASEFSCRTNDNDQVDPVECDTVSGVEGTSFSSPGAAGAALVVRDYFAQGYYPGGRASAGNRVPNISGALVKSMLIASASFLTGDGWPNYSQAFPGGDNLSILHRFNNEQGYGRIELDNVLPLDNWAASVYGLLVHDGGIDGGATDITGLTGAISSGAQVDSGTFEVCGEDPTLRIALSWLDPVDALTTGALVNDLNLEVESPSGKIYRGNYFTDDDNRNGVLDPNEDCPGLDGQTGTVSSYPWSLPICQRADASLSPFDDANPTEAVMLTTAPGVPGSDSQLEQGLWTIRVSAGSLPQGPQRYAVAIAGAVCTQSSVRLNRVEYSCNQQATATVRELSEVGDTAPTAAQVSARTTVEVLQGGTVVDTESGLLFTNVAGLQFESEGLYLTDGTERDPGNGALDVRDGDVVLVTYADTTGTRTSSAKVSCAPKLGFGNIRFAQFGQDTTYFVSGGCERNARGNFEFGFPDRYMDAQESISFNFAFASNEARDLNNVDVDLRCVIADTDSPKGCRPNSLDCADPNRTNNLTCDGRSGFGGTGAVLMTVLDSPKTIGLIPAASALSANFSIQMASSIAGTPDIDLILLVNAPTSGKATSALAISRHKLDVDEQSFFYSTDFPTGGTQFFDQSQNRAGDEILQNPYTNIGDFEQDYRFETFTWSDLTAGGTKNLGLLAPWNFDANDGGFLSGLLATTDESTITNTIAQWGEDKNFNGIDDKRCVVDIRIPCTRDSDCPSGTCQSVEQRDPADTVLNKSWNIRGGCGWQTRPPGTCSNNSQQGCFTNSDCLAPATCTGPSTTGGIWHTGRIGGTTGNCLVTGNTPGQCQAYEVVGGSSGLRAWREHLITPVMQKVNGDDYSVEIVMWRWNQAVDFPDSNARWVWEFDTDVLSLEPADLFSDNTTLGGLTGSFGAVDGSNNPRLTNGFSMFAPLTANGQNSFNGTLGNNRQGKNSCYFEGGAVDVAVVCPGCPFEPGDLGFTGPLDNDVDDDGDGAIDEYVTATGPVRNMDINAVNGPDMRFATLEDIYGDTKEFFQGSIGIWNFEADPNQAQPAIGYGVGIDDVVVEWREFNLIQDVTDCATGGECAVIDVTSNNTYEGSTLVTITVLEKSPDTENDCNLDGTLDGTNDCDGNGTPDVVVKATSNTEFLGEIVYLNLTSTPNMYRTNLPISAKYNSPGVLFVAQQGTDNPTVTVTYKDNDDGTGQLCKNDVDPAGQGRVQSQTTVFINTGNIVVLATVLDDNGDGDGFPDTNETVNMRIKIQNKTRTDLTGMAARLATNDPKIDCVLTAFINIGDLPGKGELTTTDAFTFRVGNVDRTTQGLNDLADFSAGFQILFSADQFDGTASPQEVVLDLDLDAAGGGTQTTYFESFEGGLGTFQVVNMDATLGNLAASDGYRCQYSDPDWIGSNSYGQITDCFLTPNNSNPALTYWSVNTPSDIDGGRAYSGTSSLYMGIFGPSADTHTTPLAVMEAAQMINPVNLGLTGEGQAPPELSYKHMIDLMDSRTVNAPPGDAPARGVMSIQLADNAGTPVGNWIKLQPYLNVYDQQGVDNYFNCVFDPIDDGNDEDDFFDPTDPDRRLGPSSTCKPAFSYVYMGETFLPFAEGNLGNAEGPGLRGSAGLGTWVESKFNLERFRGRRLRLRFLNTDLKAGTAATWEQLFVFNPSPGDDGWWIDDVTITNALTSPATMSNDDKPNSTLPGCGNTCNTVTPLILTDPANASLPAPGQVVELNGVDSSADRCLNGVLQFQFWIDGNGDGMGGNAADTLLRAWTDNSAIVDAPVNTTTYVMEARCSTAPSCTASTSVDVAVNCPSSGNLGFPSISAPNKTSFVWSRSLLFNWAKGNLALVSTYTTTGQNQGVGPAATFSTSADVPLAGQGLWYLFRETGPLGTGATGYCNAPGITWGQAARDAALP